MSAKTFHIFLQGARKARAFMTLCWAFMVSAWQCSITGLLASWTVTVAALSFARMSPAISVVIAFQITNKSLVARHFFVSSSTPALLRCNLPASFAWSEMASSVTIVTTAFQKLSACIFARNDIFSAWQSKLGLATRTESFSTSGTWATNVTMTGPLACMIST